MQVVRLSYRRQAGGRLLTDIFARRYADFQIWTEYGENESRLLHQCIAVAKDVLPYYDSAGKVLEWQKKKWKSIHDRLARELGVSELWPRYFTNSTKNWQGQEVQWTYENEWVAVCEMFVTYNYTAVTNKSNDRYVKERLSLIELVMRQRQEEISAMNNGLESAISEAKSSATMRALKVARDTGTRVPYDPEPELRKLNSVENRGFDELVSELNVRFQQAGVPLSYHNGYIQVAIDRMIEQQISQPFWSVIAEPIWENVALHMNQALDYRDTGAGNAALYGCMALESTIKIISDLKGWTTGKEKGAHNYIDNLVVDRDGVRFIQTFEMEVLKSYFTHVRNQLGHGPGNKPMPILSPAQTDWAIEFAMSWIRTLVRRL